MHTPRDSCDAHLCRFDSYIKQMKLLTGSKKRFDPTCIAPAGERGLEREAPPFVRQLAAAQSSHGRLAKPLTQVAGLKDPVR